MSTQYTIKATNSAGQVVAVFKAIDFADAHYDSATTVIIRFNTVLQNTTSVQAISSITVPVTNAADASAIINSIWNQIELFYNQTSLIP
jgi:hypothetical protein